MFPNLGAGLNSSQLLSMFFTLAKDSMATSWLSLCKSLIILLGENYSGHLDIHLFGPRHHR